eukprot:GEMP01019528.1.p1 GENE.GEMP01019528.1~~GEMP01019528.1.p1  ORF type:complete len:511 (+),score=138.43 GEMP01019528.1:105-1637(+)
MEVLPPLITFDHSDSAQTRRIILRATHGPLTVLVKGPQTPYFSLNDDAKVIDLVDNWGAQVCVVADSPQNCCDVIQFFVEPFPKPVEVRLSVGEPTSIAWRMLSQTPPWGTRINPTVMQSLVSHAAPLQTEDRDSNAIIPPPPVVLQNTSRKDIITPVIPPPSDARRQQPLPTTANDQSSDSDNDDVPNVPRDIDDFGAGYGSDPEDDSSSFVAAVEPARSVSHEHCSPQSDNKRQVSVNRPQSENDEEIHGAPEVNRPPGGGVFAGGSVSSLSAAEEYGGEEEDSRDVEYKAGDEEGAGCYAVDEEACVFREPTRDATILHAYLANPARVEREYGLQRKPAEPLTLSEHEDSSADDNDDAFPDDLLDGQYAANATNHQAQPRRNDGHEKKSNTIGPKGSAEKRAERKTGQTKTAAMVAMGDAGNGVFFVDGQWVDAMGRVVPASRRSAGGKTTKYGHVKGNKAPACPPTASEGYEAKKERKNGDGAAKGPAASPSLVVMQDEWDALGGI